MKHVSYTPCWTDDSQAFPSHIVVIDGKGEIRNYVPELLCYVETVPMGAHVDDGDVDVCSNCRVPIGDDVYFCSNCGARIVDRRELMRGDAE